MSAEFILGAGKPSATPDWTPDEPQHCWVGYLSDSWLRELTWGDPFPIFGQTTVLSE